MNEVQEILLRLLKELDSAFAQSNIRYSLADRLLWDAVKFGGFHDTTCDAVIMVKQEDVARISKALNGENCSGQLTEFVDSDGAESLLYADTSTALLDVARYTSQACYNVHVVIKLAKKVTWLKRVYQMPSGAKEQLPSRFFDTSTISFENCQFQITKRYKEYFSQVVGGGWKNQKWPYPINRVKFGVVARTGVSGDDFVERAESMGLLTPELEQDWKRFDLWQKEVYKPLESTVKRNNDVLGLFVERYRLWDKYCDSKSLIVERWNEGKRIPVERVLDDYLSSLKRFYRNYSVTIFFDRELFNIAAEILESQGFARKKELEEKIPDICKEEVALPV